MVMAEHPRDPVHRHHVPRDQLPHPADRGAEADGHRPDREPRLRRQQRRLLPVPGVHGAAAVPRRQHLVRRVPAARRRAGRGRVHPAPVRVPRRPPRVLDRDHPARLGRGAPSSIAGGASTHALIPLYAVGVFIDFTISQAGMVRHWIRTQDPGLAPAADDQRRRLRAHRRHRDRRDLGQVHRRRVARAAADPDASSAMMLFIRREYDAQATELDGPRRPRVRQAAPRAAGRDPGQRHQPLGRPGRDVRPLAGDRPVDAPGDVRHHRPRGGRGAARSAGSGSCRACRWSSSSRPTGRWSGRSSPTSTSSTAPGRRTGRPRRRSSCCPSTSPGTGGTGVLYNQTAKRLKAALVGREHTVIADVPYRRSDHPTRLTRRPPHEVVPAQPMIGGRRPIKGRKPADRRVRVERPHSPYFRYTGPGQLVAKPAASGPRTGQRARRRARSRRG